MSAGAHARARIRRVLVRANGPSRRDDVIYVWREREREHATTGCYDMLCYAFFYVCVCVAGWLLLSCVGCPTPSD